MAIASLASACNSQVALEMDLLLPLHRADLVRADNVTIRLSPDGPSVTEAVDDLQFTVGLDVTDFIGVARSEVYLAEGPELLAWGRSSLFLVDPDYAAPTTLLARPERLSVFPEPAPSRAQNLHVASADGRGFLVMGPDALGHAVRYDDYEPVQIADFPGDPATFAGEGAWLAGADGAFVWITYAPATRAWRYDSTRDEWSESPLVSADPSVVPEMERSGATVLVTDDRERCYLFGGGEQSDVLAISLRPDELGSLPVARVPDWSLPGGRHHARAMWIPGGEQGEDLALLFGGSDARGAPVELITAAGGPMVFGQAQAIWRDAACWASPSPEPSTPARAWCAGGRRDDGSPTADLARISWHPTTHRIELQLATDHLPAPIGQPHVFESAGAGFIEGEGHWVRIDAQTGHVLSGTSPVVRIAGGRTVTLDNDLQFLIGGTGPDGLPLTHWQVFAPAPTATAN